MSSCCFHTQLGQILYRVLLILAARSQQFWPPQLGGAGCVVGLGPRRELRDVGVALGPMIVDVYG